MKFDNSYFEDEIRDGFYIPGMIKRSWAVQLMVLEKVDEVCKRHNIKWFADCGTLIGAVRHHGFIPWDDDLDICMLRDDYDRFNAVAKEELPKEYGILNQDTEKDYTNFLTRIVNHKVIDTSDSFLKNNCEFPYVAGIDIVPLEYLFNNEEQEEERRLRGKRLLDLTQDYLDGKCELNKKELIEEVRRLSGYKIEEKVDFSAELHRALSTIFRECPSEGAKFVALNPFWTRNKTQKFDIAFFDDSILVPFENTYITVPAAYEKVLQIKYGNWEIAKREGGMHDYPFYSDQEAELAKHRGGKIPYKYYPEKNNDNAKKTSDVILQQFEILEKAHGMVGKCLEMQEYDSIFNLLENCQKIAIAIGEELEKKDKQGSLEIVGYLEQYCEKLYNLCEKINTMDRVDPLQDVKKLEDPIKQALNGYKNVFKSVKKTAFISYRSSLWKYSQPLYSKNKSEGGEVYVVPVPYYEKDINGRTGTEHFETDGYPDGVKLYDYRKIDWEHMDFDEIVIQDAYDIYKSAICVHPFFFSSNIKKYTKKLIYIQSFDAEVPEENDEKSYFNSKDYILSPGVIISDEIIVRSTEAANLYKNILGKTEMFSEAELEKKISVIEDSEEKIRKGQRTLLFYPGIASLYEKPEKTCEKIREVTDIFSKSADKMNFIWLAEDKTEENIKNICADKYEVYKELILDFERKALGKYIETSKIKEIVENTDSFYGAGGYEMNLAVQKGIPVMKWNVDTV